MRWLPQPVIPKHRAHSLYLEGQVGGLLILLLNLQELRLSSLEPLIVMSRTEKAVVSVPKLQTFKTLPQLASKAS
jgi:hypothetical protein